MSSPLEIGAATRVTLDTAYGPIACLQAGRPADRPALLVPGFTGSKEDFGPVLDPLAAAGFHVTSIDLPGQYESPGPDDPAGYAPEALASAVLSVTELIDADGRGVHLVGHSFGGLVTRAATLARPAVFASLTLMGSGPGRIGPERAALLELMRPVLDDLGVEGVYAASLQVDEAEPGYVAPSPQLAEFFRRRFLSGGTPMLRGMADALLAEPDRTDELAATGIATCVLHGVDDVPWPITQQAEMARRLDARYVVIDGAAHSPAVENPPATAAALIEFWAETD